MSEKIKVGIVGYGNLGKGVELNLKNHDDMELFGIFTRRNPELVEADSNVYNINDILNYKEEIDVLIMCGGSANDLPLQCPELAKNFNIVDSYDNHANIPKYFEQLNKTAISNKTTSIISIGWDPGLFSINRLLFDSILPQGTTHSFWGKGVSQGHSQVLRSVDGVKYGVQYTIPNIDAINKIKKASNLNLKAEDKHIRVCYVVKEDSYDEDKITHDIKNIPDYFKPYDTSVYFITEEEFFKNHQNMPHGGHVIASAITGENHVQTMEFKLTLDNNPEFTSSVLIVFARACHRLRKENHIGAYTIFDIPLKYIARDNIDILRKNIL